MPRPCTICARSDAGAINQLLHEGRSALSVAGEFRLSNRAAQRHAQNHLYRLPVDDARTAVDLDLDPLDELTAALRLRALAGNPSDTREYRLSLSAQTAARHAAASSRDLASEPEWIELRALILRLLEPFPEARQAVAGGLGAD